MSVDVFSPAKRSAVMRAVKSADTAPERRVRKLLSAEGYRYRLNVRALPGAPDIVLRSRSAAIFVHGCFWHGHVCKRGARLPKANSDYWRAKIGANRARDDRNLAALKSEGWRPLTIWECELKDEAAL
ncbi:MAG: DNA mismatch endonuclease Vsr, partial [Pseudomonadota bacterium]